jgi:excinuclease UvrABC ATPase subunit
LIKIHRKIITTGNPFKAYDETKLYLSCNQQNAGMKPSHFSFNVDGGRCMNVRRRYNKVESSWLMYFDFEIATENGSKKYSGC